MNRCVVNVGWGKYYERGQQRLASSLREFDPGCELNFRSDIPPDWPAHKEKPYAFKVMSLEEASNGHDLILWLDSSIVAISSMEPLWERIERDGYFLVNGSSSNYEWTADSAYADLFPGVPIENARRTNRTIPQIVGGVIGLNVQSKIGADFLREYYRLAKDTTAFCGPWANSNCPSRPIYDPEPYTTEECGPSDVMGHRHDQTAASVLAWKFGMKLAEYPAPYAYTTPGEGTILLHDGPGLADVEEIIGFKRNLGSWTERSTADSKIACPECSSTAVGMAGGMRRCNQCGYAW